ncbi:hypothetical protein NSIN_20282 [Nitrosotalea sinensis]|uniref:Uncharacterized protein n=1 Tax=Nitrosotalea sinensis TaxID=1499975 RepID=A0A2H1EFR7_9ARCH|nr:hypothetical protein [Candidatus Nitrosotalea sinensis]SHO44264.1 hypothetical protein NSIN_20282 [Candidatus Nitrosotalea sinensis]
MNFSEILLQYMQKYYTKPHETINLLFAMIAGFAALSAIIITLSEKIPDALSRIIAITFTPIMLLIAVLYVGKKAPKENKKVLEIEHAIMLNHDIIDGFNPLKRRRVLELIHPSLTEKNTDDKFNELMNILNSRTST